MVSRASNSGADKKTNPCAGRRTGLQPGSRADLRKERRKPLTSTLAVLSPMTLKLKQITVAVAKAINNIPVVKALTALKTSINAKIALSLFRRRRFAVAALLRYWLRIILTLSLFILTFDKLVHDPSLLMKYGKTWLVFVPFSYSVMQVFSRVEYYQSRKDRFRLSPYFRHRYDEQEAELPANGKLLLLLLGSWVVLLVGVYIYS